MFSLLSCCTFPMCPHQELDVCEWPCRVQVCPILVASKRILGLFCTTLKKLHNDVRHFHQTPSKHQRLNTSCCPRPWCCCCYLMQAAHTNVTVISTVIVLLHNSSYQQRKRKKKLAKHNHSNNNHWLKIQWAAIWKMRSHERFTCHE